MTPLLDVCVTCCTLARVLPPLASESWGGRCGSLWLAQVWGLVLECHWVTSTAGDAVVPGGLSEYYITRCCRWLDRTWGGVTRCRWWLWTRKVQLSNEEEDVFIALICVLVCICAQAVVHVWMCGFPPSTRRILGIEFRSSGLMAVPLPTMPFVGLRGGCFCHTESICRIKILTMPCLEG